MSDNDNSEQKYYEQYADILIKSKDMPIEAQELLWRLDALNMGINPDYWVDMQKYCIAYTEGGDTSWFEEKYPSNIDK